MSSENSDFFVRPIEGESARLHNTWLSTMQFGSAPDGHVSRARQAEGDYLDLEGAAYAAANPNEPGGLGMTFSNFGGALFSDSASTTVPC